MKYKLMTITTAATLSILLTLSVSLPAYSFSGVTGNWVITQAASQSRGAAPTLIACGTFALTVDHPTDQGPYTGSISFSVTNFIPNGLNGLTIPGVNGVP
ncbi:MAG: hypothetical protein HYY68_04610, partial [Thaumarchaeota archaeon]|nr:hypothetical protein [Nitrososphaerota archaeon]